MPRTTYRRALPSPGHPDAVVPKDVPPWTLVGGVPAKVLGRRPPGLRYELQARRFKAWWW